MKRAREDYDGERPAAKVRRVGKLDRLSKLSDELLVRILSFVPVTSLLVCQRYCHALIPYLNALLTVTDYRKSSVAFQ